MPPDPWDLPSARAFLADVQSTVHDGGSLVIGDVSTPPSLVSAVTTTLRQSDSRVLIELIDSAEADRPAEALADAFRLKSADATSLAADAGLFGHVALVDQTRAEKSVYKEWLLFLSRFLPLRQQNSGGLSIIVILPDNSEPPHGQPACVWNRRMRRLDITIWADLHTPLNRTEPLAGLAAALAVELCGWRLDLAEALASADRSDLLEPLEWLERWRGQTRSATGALDGVATTCPLALLEAGDTELLRLRLWRAQLRALFPWIEELRQEVIRLYRRSLYVDAHQRGLGVIDVAELEFGAIAYQLKGRIARIEHEVLAALGRIRNHLAHRKPVRRTDLEHVLTHLHRIPWARQSR